MSVRINTLTSMVPLALAAVTLLFTGMRVVSGGDAVGGKPCCTQTASVAGCSGDIRCSDSFVLFSPGNEFTLYGDPNIPVCTGEFCPMFNIKHQNFTCRVCN